jgi:hypothetical protein
VVFLTHGLKVEKGRNHCWCLLQTVCGEEENNYLVDIHGLLTLREEHRLRVC